MIYSIENSHLKISVDTMGAQLFSIYSKKTKNEYLWQGNPEYWTGRAYNLFPFIGRMYESTYYYADVAYQNRAHGLARYFPFALEERTATKLVFLFTENEETLKEYPFRFEFRVYFELFDNRLDVHYMVKNTDDRELICAFGGHPGINVPFEDEAFEDCYLEFAEKTNVKRQLLSESCRFMADKAEPYEMEDGVRIPLQHNLFDYDAIILSNTCRCVSVKSKKCKRYVTMRYDDYKYIGFWQVGKTDAPYVCLEPWSALPASDGVCDQLETKKDMTHVAPNATAKMSYSLEIHE